MHRLKDTKAKKLTDGEQRRLTIAEDIVHGPHLILMDEPITGLDPREASIIMTHAVRELVNQDRTVILTLYQVRKLQSYLHNNKNLSCCLTQLLLTAAISGYIQPLRYPGFTEQRSPNLHGKCCRCR